MLIIKLWSFLHVWISSWIFYGEWESMLWIGIAFGLLLWYGFSNLGLKMYYFLHLRKEQSLKRLQRRGTWFLSISAYSPTNLLLFLLTGFCLKKMIGRLQAFSLSLQNQVIMLPVWWVAFSTFMILNFSDVLLGFFYCRGAIVLLELILQWRLWQKKIRSRLLIMNLGI